MLGMEIEGFEGSNWGFCEGVKWGFGIRFDGDEDKPEIEAIETGGGDENEGGFRERKLTP